MANQLIVTDAGIQALINSQKTGTNALVLSSVQLGTGKYTADAGQTSLEEPFKTLTTIAGGTVGDNIIHITLQDTDAEAYEVYEIGVFTDDGVLFAVYAQDTPIVQKAELSYFVLSMDFPVLAAGDGDIVVSGDITFTNPPATTETAGIVELATPEETQEGTDNSRAVTPLGLTQALSQTLTYDVIESEGIVITIGSSNGVTFSEI